jgi:Acetyltransferase (GNAT) domain
MIVEKLDETDAKRTEWTAFLMASAAGNVFALPDYLDAIEAERDIWVVRGDDGLIEAGLPLVRGPARFYTNPLYCKYLGFMFRSRDQPKDSTNTSRYYKLVEPFEELIRSTPTFDYFFHPSCSNWLPFYWCGLRQQTHLTYVIPNLSRSTWWDQSDSRLRNATRRGLKSGLTIREVMPGLAADIAAAYRLIVTPYVSRGARPLVSWERFERIARYLLADNVARIWLAEDNSGVPVSAALVLYDWRSAYFLMNGTAQDAPTGANAALLVHIVHDAMDRGLDFDFEGSMIKPIEAFYRSFSPVLQPYSRIWTPSVLNSAKRAGTAIFRRVGGYRR